MVSIRLFDYTESGVPVYSYTLKNRKNESVEILNFGAIIRRISVLDKSGKLRDIVLGFDDVKSYIGSDTYFGAFIGRVANRISGCKFSLEGQIYTLYDNNNGVSLHGGKNGFDKKLLTASVPEDDFQSVVFFGISPDGEEGYPGTVFFSVKYTLTDDSNLIIDYKAETDKPTLFNVTNHSYFNLNGHDSDRNNYETYLKLNSRHITPLGDDFTPTGEIRDISGTPFDFTSFKKIGRDIDARDAQMLLAGGYDINYVFDISKDLTESEEACMRNILPVPELKPVAYAYSEDSGICMEVQTTLPCMQLYSGNFMKDSTGKDGAHYDYRYGFCLETQLFPDAVNKKSFPPVTLVPDKPYQSRTVYSFATLG
ncbi:MAG: galactose mutarotase [Clostridia bacterium]|nr:galactose mutarotase [Clostridia bacterium]